jgi:hypothetical protein
MASHFPSRNRLNQKRGRNLILKDEDLFENALDEIFEENKKGFILFGRS